MRNRYPLLSTHETVAKDTADLKSQKLTMDQVLFRLALNRDDGCEAQQPQKPQVIPACVGELQSVQGENHEVRSALSEVEQRMRTLFDHAPDAIVVLDVESEQFLDANSMAERLFGLRRESLLELGPFELSPASQPGGLSSEFGREKITEAVIGGVSAFEWWHRNAQGERFPCEVNLVRIPWENRVVLRGSILETSEKKILELSEAGRSKILEQIANGASLSELLGHLVLKIESLLPGMLCSVLLLDHETNCLRHGAAPSLPDFYNNAIDGLTIGPTVGSCGAAAFTGQRVIVSDVTNHANWAAFQQLAEQAHVKACWSEPILSLTGEVLGTFAMYYGEPSNPSLVELKAIQAAAQLVAIAIDRVKAQRSLEEMNESLQRRVAQETRRLVEANQQLRASEQDARLAAIAFETHDSIAITNKGGKILRVNQSFTKLTGYSSEDVIGKTPRILRSGRHSKEFYQAMWQAIRTEGFWEGEVWNKREDGHVYLQRLTITAVRNESGEITHYVGDGQDLTEAKQAAANCAAINAARKIQESLYPSRSPCVPGFDIAGAVHPAEDASGDYFDYITLGDGSIGVLVADVSSHGLGPALLMAQMQAYIRTLADSYDDPAVLLNHADKLFSLNVAENFVTLFLGRLDIETGSLLYAGAGHQGYIIASDGTVTVLRSTGIPLGVDTDVDVSSAPAVALKPGDIILLPTDGIEETMSPDGRMFGRDRAFDVVRKSREKSAAEIVEVLFRAAREFADGKRQGDDITSVVVKVLPTTEEDELGPQAGE